MAFTPINTQEEFDAAIADRLSRDRAKYAKQFEAEMKEKGWKTTEEVATLTKDLTDKVAALTAQVQSQTETINGHQAEMDGLNAKLHNYETASVKTAVALEMGIINKSFDEFERQLVSDIIAGRVSAEADRAQLFTD